MVRGLINLVIISARGYDVTSGQVVHAWQAHASSSTTERERERAEQPDRKTVLAVASGWTYYTAGPAKPISHSWDLFYCLENDRPAVSDDGTTTTTDRCASEDRAGQGCVHPWHGDRCVGRPGPAGGWLISYPRHHVHAGRSQLLLPGNLKR